MAQTRGSRKTAAEKALTAALAAYRNAGDQNSARLVKAERIFETAPRDPEPPFGVGEAVRIQFLRARVVVLKDLLAEVQHELESTASSIPAKPEEVT